MVSMVGDGDTACPEAIPIRRGRNARYASLRNSHVKATKYLTVAPGLGSPFQLQACGIGPDTERYFHHRYSSNAFLHTHSTSEKRGARRHPLIMEFVPSQLEANRQKKTSHRGTDPDCCIGIDRVVAHAHRPSEIRDRKSNNVSRSCVDTCAPQSVIFVTSRSHCERVSRC